MIDKNVEIMRLHDEGKSIRSIAEELGVNRGSVEYVIKKSDSVIENAVIKPAVIEESVIENDTVIEPVIKRYCTKEEIYEIPIIKLFKWKLTPEEEEEVMSTGELHPNQASDYDMLRGYFHPEKIMKYDNAPASWMKYKVKSKK